MHMSANMVDAFLNNAAAPLLKAAGFKRRRREFALEGPGRAIGTVAFYPDNLSDSAGFLVQYGVVTEAQQRLIVDSGACLPKFLSPSEALMQVCVFAPAWQREPLDPYRWRLGESANGDEKLADELRATLVGEAIPNINAWFEPEQLADAIATKGPGRFIRGTTESAIALALFGGGRSDKLNDALASLPASSEVGEWIREQLHKSTLEGDVRT